MKSEYQKRLDIIEGFIDESTVKELLEDVSNVCILKSKHIAKNYNDIELANIWSNASKKILGIIDKIDT